MWHLTKNGGIGPSITLRMCVYVCVKMGGWYTVTQAKAFEFSEHSD